MRAHEDLVKELKKAAQKGEDLLPILQASHEHLIHCTTCLNNIMQLATTGLERGDVLMWVLTQLEELGQLPEPPFYPRLDFSFLRQPVWTSSMHTSREGISQRIRELAEIKLQAKIDKRKRSASFEGLSGALASSIISGRTPVVESARRGQKVGMGQTLTLPDREGNIQITVAIQAGSEGTSYLSVEASEIEPDRPLLHAQVILHRLDGNESASLKKGKAKFIGLDPGDYTVEIRPIQGEKTHEVWRFTITLEPA